MKHYRSFSCKTQGAKHIKENLVCQDAALNFDDEKMSVAIVADGHGSPQYFRSDRGSRFAAEVALEGIKGFVAQTTPDTFVSNKGEEMLNRLAKNIIAAWYGKVDEDEKQYPLKDDEKVNVLENKYKDKYLNDPEHQHLYHAYGTTLIAVAMTDYCWFGLHIGDGKCIALFDDGSWEQPIPWDDKCFLCVTTSLCDDNAFEQIRFWHGSTSIDNKKPIAVFVCSDGVDDSYPVHENEKHLERLYRSIVLGFAKDGYDNTLRAMEPLIQKLAEQGSGDDVSIAGIIGDINPLVSEMSARDEADKTVSKAIEEQKKAITKKQEAENAFYKATEEHKQIVAKIQEAKQDIEQYKRDQQKAEDSLRGINKNIEKTKKEQRRADARLQDAEKVVTKAMNEKQKAGELLQGANNAVLQAEKEQIETTTKLEQAKKGIDKTIEEQKKTWDLLQPAKMMITQTEEDWKKALASLQEANVAVDKAVKEQQAFLVKPYAGADNRA